MNFRSGYFGGLVFVWCRSGEKFVLLFLVKTRSGEISPQYIKSDSNILVLQEFRPRILPRSVANVVKSEWRIKRTQENMGTRKY